MATSGDRCGAWAGGRGGGPIERRPVAASVTALLARPLSPGTYELRDVTAAASPSMDIQVSSNFERLLFEAYGRDATAVRGLMGSLAQSRRFEISARAPAGKPPPLSPPRAHQGGNPAAVRPPRKEAGCPPRPPHPG